MYESRDNGYVTDSRSILKRFSDQFPEDIVISSPLEMVSGLMHVSASNLSLLAPVLDSAMSICFYKSAWNLLNRSSNKSATRYPASSRRLLP